MKRMLVLLLLATCHGSVAAESPIDSDFEAVGAMLDSAVEQRRIPSAVAVIEMDGRIAWQHAAGDMAPGVPMRADPVLPLASVGKMFTATAAMMLYERGIIALDDPVARFLPAFADAKVTTMVDGRPSLQPARRAITVFHLLTHTSGLVVDGEEFWGVWDAHVAKTTTADFARDLLALGLQSQPGERFDYGQTGAAYEVLGAVIERASGQTLEAFMHEHIFEPLGLRDSYFYLPADKSDRLPAIFRNTDGRLELDRPAGEDFSRSTFFHGGGGVRSAPADVLRFARLFLDGGTVDGVRLLKPATVAMMMRDQLGDLAPPHWRERGMSWGFGASVTCTRDAGCAEAPDRYGWVGGGFAKLWVDPRRRMVAYLNFTLTPPGDNELLREFERRVYEVLAAP